MLLYLLIIQLMVYNRTITRFAADDKPFISEWDGIYDWLQTTAEHDVVWSMWAGDHGELLFLCTHLNREWQFYTKSHELIGAFFVYPPDWGQGPPLLRDKRGLPLSGCGTIIVPVLCIHFSKLSMLPSFQLLLGNWLITLRAPYRFDR